MTALLLLIVLVSLVVVIMFLADRTKVNALLARVASLEREMDLLKRRMGDHRHPTSEEPIAPPPPDVMIAPLPQPHAPISIPSPLPVPPQASAPKATPSRTKEEWEALIGGKLLNRIGAVAIIICAGLFLKYAFDNNWITETMRVVIGSVVGIGLLLTAARTWRTGFEIFAQGLVGAGIAILYLSVYASFNFYHLVSQPVAFAFMSGVTAIAFSQAFLYNTIAVSALGLLGGFLTPYLLSTGEANVVGLFGYIALLDLGLLLVIVKKDAWAILEPMAIAGTYITFFLWYGEYYQRPDQIPALLLLTLFWTMFHLLDVYRVRKDSDSFFDLRRVMASMHAVLYYAGMLSLLTDETSAIRAGATLLFAAANAATSFVCRGGTPRRLVTFNQFIETTIILVVLATVIHFERFTLVMLWALESLILVVWGTRRGIRTIWGNGLALFGITLLTLLAIPAALFATPVSDFTPLTNERTLTFLVVIVTLVLSVRMVDRLQPGAHRAIPEGLHYAWVLFAVLLVTVEVNDFHRQLMVGQPDDVQDRLRYARFLWLSVAWTAAATPLIFGGLRLRLRPLLYTGAWLLLFAAILAGVRGATYVPITEFTLLVNKRSLAVLLVIAACFLTGSWTRRHGADFEWLEELRKVSGIIPMLLILILLSAETRDYFQREIAAVPFSTGRAVALGEINRLENLEQLSLSSLWLLISILLMIVGLWKRERTLRFQAIILFGIAILKIFIYDLSFLETLYRIFSFLGLGVILLAVSFLYQRYRTIILEPSPPPFPS